VGLRTTATMMYGSVDTLEDRVEHLQKLRDLQDESLALSPTAFTAFIAWNYQPDGTELGGTRASAFDYMRTIAISRIFLDNFPNIQASWVTQGPRIGQLSLRYGVNDFGSTMMEENVVSTAGCVFTVPLEEIERLLTEVKSVTDTLAHDLRTPLTRLRLTLYRAQQQFPGDQPEHALLDNALDETDALLARFRALLRISEIENRQRKSAFRSVNPEEVLLQLIELFEPLAEDASVNLTLAYETTSPIYADPDLLFEALSNLIDNAIKFTPAAGSVWIKLSQINGIPHIDIIDTGCGVPVQEREAVMLRFHRSNNTQTDHPGHGLGLSIVAAVMRLHGFRLQFQETAIGTHLTVVCSDQIL